MALSINTNVASLNAQRNLQRSQESLNTSLQRLSTGLRSNSAKDDAAGLAISTRFTTQINGLNQAVRNANDGISLAQTGEAALDEITNNLQRIRELAVQSANATNSASDRQALNAEVQQRLAEIDRIGGQTSFNGSKVLDGSLGTAAFQVGANVGETISINLASGVKATQIGQYATGTSGAVTVTTGGAGVTTSGEVAIKVGNATAVAIGASEAGSKYINGSTDGGQNASSAYAKATAINNASIAGLTATATTSATETFAAVAADTAYSFDVNGVNVLTQAATGTAGVSRDQLVAAINQQSNLTGVTAVADGAGDFIMTAADGSNIETIETAGLGAGGGTTIVGGEITLSASDAITVTGSAKLGITSGTVFQVDSTTSVSTATVNTVDEANKTLFKVDAALESVSSLRSDFGAIQNRFESTITNLQTISENLSASRGRILDADFAAETANLTKAQILQQAGTAILAQANALPQAALSLLQ
jgi:flagellin